MAAISGLPRTAGGTIESAPPPECTVSGGYRSGAAGSSPWLSSRPTVARVVTREHRCGRGTLPRQSRKATPGGAARAARRSGSEFAKRMSSGDARRRHRRSPRTRTPPNGSTSESASADRRGRGTLQRKVGKRLERRRGSGTRPVSIVTGVEKARLRSKRRGFGDMPRLKSPHQRTGAVAGLCASKVGKRLERRRGSGICPV